MAISMGLTLPVGLVGVGIVIAASHLDRRRLAGFGFAVFLVSSLLVRSFGDIWLGIGWIGLFGGFLLAPDKTRGPILYAGAVLLVCHALAIPGSLLWGDGHWEATTAIVLWMAPSLLILTTGINGVFPWLVPAWLLHAALILYAGPTSWSGASGVLVSNGGGTGLSHNPNLAAGFLCLGIVYLMTTRFRWLVLPLIVALLFTGSRWGLTVTGVMLLLMVLTRAVSFKPLGATVLLCAAIVVAVSLFTPLGYRVSTLDSFGAVVHTVNGEVRARMAVPHIPSVLPRGVAEHPGLHNVPLRIAVESGILAALVWLGITGWALWPRGGVKPEGFRGNHQPEGNSASMDASERSGRFGASWWMLLALALLSLLDYYTWMGHLGGFWWLLVGMLVKSGVTARPAWSDTDRPLLIDDSVTQFLTRLRR
jgi:hypothetical protein